MNQILIGVFIFTILLIIIYKKVSITQKQSHKWRLKSAVRALELIRNFQNKAQVVAYLRKLDPFVFEELLLLAISKNKNCKIIRNHKYTGDGGIDGKFIYQHNGKEYLYVIQVKRYSSYVKNQDVLEFAKKIKEEQVYRGLFIHTGRSGVGVRKNIFYSNSIELISGNKLIYLIKNGFYKEENKWQK